MEVARAVDVAGQLPSLTRRQPGDDLVEFIEPPATETSTDWTDHDLRPLNHKGWFVC